MNFSETSEISKDQNLRVVSSEELFSGAHEIFIQHNKERYRLLITKAGKLILNK